MTTARQNCWALLLGLSAALPAQAQTPAPETSGPPLRIRQFRDDIVVDSEGRVVQHYGSGTTPESKELQAAIEQLL